MIHWTIRAATPLYVYAILSQIRGKPSRLAWTAGCALYLAHVAAAFHYTYQWSHAIAVRETARQTEALFGIYWGGGIWFNYAFTAVWTLDALWWLAGPDSRRHRPAIVDIAMHAFMAWMFVNAAIVFPTGPVRWAASALAAAVALFWLRSRRVMLT